MSGNQLLPTIFLVINVLASPLVKTSKGPVLFMPLLWFLGFILWLFSIIILTFFLFLQELKIKERRDIMKYVNWNSFKPLCSTERPLFSVLLWRFPCLCPLASQVFSFSLRLCASSSPLPSICDAPRRAGACAQAPSSSFLLSFPLGVSKQWSSRFPSCSWTCRSPGVMDGLLTCLVFRKSSSGVVFLAWMVKKKCSRVSAVYLFI